VGGLCGFVWVCVKNDLGIREEWTRFARVLDALADVNPPCPNLALVNLQDGRKFWQSELRKQLQFRMRGTRAGEGKVMPVDFREGYAKRPSTSNTSKEFSIQLT